MNITKRILPLLLSLCLIFTMAGCGSSGEAAKAPESAPSAVTVTDMMGRTVTLDKPAQRVVALPAADCEILFAIGAGETLVGRDQYCDYPAQVLDVPVVGSGTALNIEEIIALRPDLLIVTDMNQTEEQIENLESAGVKVAVSDAKDIEGVYTSIEMIGKLVGKEENAASVIDSMKNTFSELSKKAAEFDGKTVYFEVSPLEYGLWTAGANTYMDEVASMIGLTNCFADVDGWAEISEEQLISRDPDLIVTITMYFGEGPSPEDEILSRAGWENVTAVKSKAILNLQNNELSRPAPRLVEGAQLLFDFAYPEAAGK